MIAQKGNSYKNGLYTRLTSDHLGSLTGKRNDNKDNVRQKISVSLTWLYNSGSDIITMLLWMNRSAN